MVLETPRLLLREFTPADLDPMLGVFGDAEVMRFGKGAQTRQWVANWLARRKEIYLEQPGKGLWAVVIRGTTAPIGYCGLTWFPDVGGQPDTEIGYRLVRNYWGQGYATEAALAVRDHALQTLKLDRLVAIIHPDNTASLRVAAKLGMYFEREIMFKDYSEPDHLYVVTPACNFRYAC